MNTALNEGNGPLQRTLEPEVMDDEREVREYQAMDHSTVNQAFVVDLISGGQVGPKVVDLGCGTALIPVILCEKRSDVEVLAVDCAVEMLEAARLEIELSSMLGRIHLEQSDCKELSGFADAMADTVISNTVLHHIADPQRFLIQAVRITAPGGRLFIRDLVRPASESEVEQLVDLHAATETDYARQLLRQSLHAALTLAEIRALLNDLNIPASAVQMTSDRHWTLDHTRP